MAKLEIFFVFVVLTSHSLQTPLDIEIHKRQFTKTDRVENKNWKLKAGLFENNERNLQQFNDAPTTYRLPNNTLPLRYDLFIKTDVDRHIFEFTGRVKIQIKAMETTSVVTLQYRELYIEKVSMIDVTGEVVNENLHFEYVEPRSFEFLRISLPRLVTIDEIFTLEISYKGVLNNREAGFYRAYYYDGIDIIYYAVTQFEATDARRAFPCFDEPGIRAIFSLEIQHAKHYDAYSNMELISKTPIGNDYYISKFNETPPMQTYILAFLVAPFEFISNNDTNVPQRILAKPSSIRNGEAEFAIALTGPILRKLEEHFGMKFSLSKLDHAAITQFEAGAMENWGLVTYREIVLLFEAIGYPEIDEPLKRRIITVMAHEDAHQFFGNLVSPHWWTDLWLNEGLATLYEYYLPHLLYPDDGYMESFRKSELDRCFYVDLPHLSSSVPMSYYVESPMEIDYKFDDISYSKGGAVMRMFQEAFGIDTFTRGLTKYLMKMSMKSAMPSDLFSSIQEAVDEDRTVEPLDVSKTMGSWIYQAGYPIVSVSINGSNLVLKQNRYPTGNEIYSIPLSFASRTEPDFERKTAKLWLHVEQMEVPLQSLKINNTDWIIFNVQQTAYFRMNYSPELWHLIATGLRENTEIIHPVNREILLTELQIGYSNLQQLLASDVFEVLLYLVYETKVNMWDYADLILSEFQYRFIGTEVHEDFLKYLQFITRLQLEEIGLENLDGESFDKKRFRDILRYYNCLAIDDLCLEHETTKLQLYLEDDNNPLPNFCVALRHATMPIFLRFLNDIVNDQSKNRGSIMSGISCTLDENQLKLLTYIVEDMKNDLLFYERELIIGNMMMSSNTGLKVAFEYLERNVEYISWFVASLRLAINTQDYSDRLDILFNDAVAEDFITIELARSVRESVRLNLEWQAKHFDAAREWFDDVDGKMTTTERPEPTSTTPQPDSATGAFGSFTFIFIAIFFIKIFD